MADSSLTLTELVGAALQPGRSLELRGAGLPFQDAEWGGEQRIPERWPAGNPEATQHVLGPRELPSEWEGMWRRTLLGSAPCIWTVDGNQGLVVEPADLRDIIDAWRVEGALLKVVWSSGGREVLRVGRISRATFPHVRMADIKWTMTLQWMGRGGSQQRVIALRQDDASAEQDALNIATAKAATALLDAVTAFQDAAGSADTFTLGDLEALADAPFAALQQFSDAALFFTNQGAKLSSFVGTIAGKVAGAPATIAKMGLDLAAAIVTSAMRATDSWTAIPGELIGGVGASASALVNAVGLGDTVVRASDASVDIALALIAKAKGKAGGTPATGAWDPSNPDPAAVLKIVVAKAGETFASIAKQVYGSADFGAALASANGLPGYQIAPAAGQILIVPVLSALPTI